jgi:hypothetical protein
MRRIRIMAGILLLGSLGYPAHAQEGLRPPAELVVEPGMGSATPLKQAVAWANGGVIDVAQPNATTLVITMSGLTAVNADLCRTSVARYRFDLNQRFAVVVNSPRVKGTKLTLEGQGVGLLRTSHESYQHVGFCANWRCPTADTDPAKALITNPAGQILALVLPSRCANGCTDLSVYDHDGPFTAAVKAGSYELREMWGFGTAHPSFVCHGASAEFSPQPAYYAGIHGPYGYWFEHFQPFNGAASKDFGFRVVVKLIPEF